MDIEEIINNTLTRMRQEQELRRVALLELLYKNIDLLIDNASAWFGNDVPGDYKNIVRSLMVVSTSFLSDDYDFRSMVFDDPFEEIEVNVLINEVVRETSSLDRNKKIILSFDRDHSTVMTSRKKLRNSLITIILAFMVFMDEHSGCDVTVAEDKSSVTINIRFGGLLPSFPGIDRMQKAFFPYLSGREYRMGIGIDFALYTLRNIGAIVKVFSTGYGNTGTGITITFPTMEFHNLMNEIRINESLQTAKTGEGLVLLVTDDLILEMLIGEMLHENGYRIKKTDIASLDKQREEDCKAVIADLATLHRKRVASSSFREWAGGCSRVILIHGADVPVGDYLAEGVIPLIKPFDLDRIVNALEGDGSQGGT